MTDDQKGRWVERPGESAVLTDSDRVHILVVDDLPDKVLVLQSILEELGQSVIVARSGEEALRRVLEHDFAVILLDVNMPGMDGFETAALIRRRRKSAQTPIIFITAFADELHTAQGYSLGAVDYILSPVIPEVLRTKVRVFVELFQMAQRVRRQAEERVNLAREQAARAAAEEATRRSAFLAEASRVLASSLDPQTTLQALARVVVPFLADVSAVVQLEQGELGPTELAWASSGHVLTRTVAGPEDLSPALAFAVRQVVGSRKVELLPGSDIPHLGGLDNAAVNGSPGPPWSDGLLRPALVLPVQARKRLLAVLLLARGPSGRRFDGPDLVLAEDLASRAAISLDNARLHQDIQEGDRRKDEFLAMLAHELRNPLAPVRNAVEVLRLRGLPDPLLVQARDMIERQVKHMARLIDDLLDVSRLSRGKILLRTEQVELGQLVRATCDDYRGMLAEHGLTLHAEIGEQPLFVRGDPTRLAQILGNVLHNASKFTDPGGEVTITVTGGPAGHVTLKVRDTGIGMEPEMLARVFEAFSQADNSLARSRGGLGLGLTLVKGLVELHGGEARLASAGLGKGTEVSIRLPLAQARPVAAQAVAPHSTGTYRILIIEDNVDAAESMRILLTLGGHQVALAYNGTTGLETARAFGPDVVLCDIGLPGDLDGYAVARVFREDAALSSAYLIAATGYGQAEDQSRAREAGFDAHLTKPIDLPMLEELLGAAGEKVSGRT
jgi:signal transduction histidine kinase